MIANCYNVMMLLINSQNIPCKSILTNRWCFHLQVAKTEFLLTLSKDIKLTSEKDKKYVNKESIGRSSAKFSEQTSEEL